MHRTRRYRRCCAPWPINEQRETRRVSLRNLPSWEARYCSLVNELETEVQLVSCGFGGFGAIAARGFDAVEVLLRDITGDVDAAEARCLEARHFGIHAR